MSHAEFPVTQARGQPEPFTRVSSSRPNTERILFCSTYETGGGETAPPHRNCRLGHSSKAIISMRWAGIFRGLSGLFSRARATSPGTPSREVEAVDQRAEDEIVLFLREWLPEPVKEEYRKLMRANPNGWHRHPHFANGIVVVHLLRGNGISESALGVRSFDTIWPKLLRLAVEPPLDHPEPD